MLLVIGLVTVKMDRLTYICVTKVKDKHCVKHVLFGRKDLYRLVFHVHVCKYSGEGCRHVNERSTLELVVYGYCSEDMLAAIWP